MAPRTIKQPHKSGKAITNLNRTINQLAKNSDWPVATPAHSHMLQKAFWEVIGSSARDGESVTIPVQFLRLVKDGMEELHSKIARQAAVLFANLPTKEREQAEKNAGEWLEEAAMQVDEPKKKKKRGAPAAEATHEDVQKIGTSNGEMPPTKKIKQAAPGNENQGPTLPTPKTARKTLPKTATSGPETSNPLPPMQIQNGGRIARQQNGQLSGLCEALGETFLDFANGNLSPATRENGRAIGDDIIREGNGEKNEGEDETTTTTGGHSEVYGKSILEGKAVNMCKDMDGKGVRHDNAIDLTDD